MARVRWWLKTTWPYLLVVWIYVFVAIGGWLAGPPDPGHQSDWYSPETVVGP